MSYVLVAFFHSYLFSFSGQILHLSTEGNTMGEGPKPLGSREGRYEGGASMALRGKRTIEEQYEECRRVMGQAAGIFPPEMLG